MLKKIFTFLLFLLPWFLGSILFSGDPTYYTSLNLPTFAPPSALFGIVWAIIYILIAISIYTVYESEGFNKSYLRTLIINYILNQLFTFSFFTLESPLLGMINTIAVFISSLWLYYETKKVNNKASKYLVPYIVWTLFASILSIFIFLLNS